MLETSLATVVLVICLALLARVLMPARYRRALDRRAQQAWWRLRHAGQSIRYWRRARRADAEREAREAIERASRKRTLH